MCCRRVVTESVLEGCILVPSSFLCSLPAMVKYLFSARLQDHLISTLEKTGYGPRLQDKIDPSSFKDGCWMLGPSHGTLDKTGGLWLQPKP